MLMLDLCAGLGGASAAFRARGWDVVTVDADPAFACDITADIRTWQWTGPQPDFVWSSPPCDEFAREFMPWSRTGVAPDMTLVLACLHVIRVCAPRYWALENVQGAIAHITPLLGPPRLSLRPWFVWGRFPDIGKPRIVYRGKERLSSSQAAERARIPYALSMAFAVAIEAQMEIAL